MDTNWSQYLIADHVTKWCKQKESNDGAQAKIDLLVTFDRGGVSGHPNHIAIFHGVYELMYKKMLPGVEVMTLTSVTLLRKYLGIIDISCVWTNEWHAFRYNFIEAYKTLALH